MNGVLVLVGGGEFQPEMKYVDRVLLDHVIGPPRIAILPTAAGKDPDTALKLGEAGASYFREMDAEADAIPVIDRESAMDEGLAARIEDANVVYMTDGDSRYLYNTLQFSHAWTSIGNVIELNGLVAASGAAASVFGERSPGSALRWGPAFNILPGSVIVPDYATTSPFGMRMRRLRRRGLACLGIDRHTALFNRDFQFTVVGEGGVTVWSTKRHEERDDGDPLIWP
ncbi:MAG: Type 1 glutamine amidotransferase-like domain-containing protein [Dehalococcoidia bacterium]|jgi:cyanophycinase-like exopeptidase|nr:Type 1 glutamine amidotransferase-like domain-containing protein [Dehalococcoidia bacterium]